MSKKPTYEELEERVKSLEKERIEIFSESKKKLARYIIQLSGAVAHNINNALSPINMAAELIQYDINKGDPNYKHLDNIIRSVKKGSKFTSQLLGFVGKGNYNPEIFNLNQIIIDINSEFKLTNENLKSQYIPIDGPVYLKADKNQINRVLSDLYQNACEAMEGKGNMIIETKKVTHEDVHDDSIKLKPGKYVSLTIADTGCGMDQETQARAFNPFFSTKDKSSHVGLALASARGIIKYYSGSISLISQKGYGTNFIVYLPIEEIDKTKEELSDKVSTVKKDYTILVVDDEDSIRKVTKARLERMGYNVILAEDGAEAVEKYTGSRDMIDMVILDMRMPIMTGDEAFYKLKDINPDVKVQISTGYQVGKIVQQMIKDGCKGVISKPIGEEEFSGIILETLGTQKHPYENK